MSDAFSIDTSVLHSAPANWERRPLWTLIKRRDVTGYPDAELLSVYREHGVVPKDSRDDNFNKPSEDLGSYRLVRPGDLVLNKMKTWQGSLAVSQYEGIVSPAYFVCELSSEVYPRFAHHLLRSRPYIHLYQAASKGIRPNQWDLPFDNFRTLPMLLPPLEEQRRIADFLDAETARIDKLSDVTERQVLALSERLQELFRESTTTGSNATVRTGIDWMPLISEDWTLNKVAHHFTVGGGTTPSSAGSNYFGDGVYWVNSADIKNGIIESPSKSVTLEAIRDYPSLEIHPRGSLVIALYGQGGTKGRVGILGVEACLNQACCALNESGRVKAEYAFFWFRAHKEGVISLAVGAGQPNLSQDLIKSLRIPAPRVDEQLNIVDRLKSEEKHSARLIASLESRKRLLSERRQALITAAVTGEFDVSAASGRGIEE